MRGLNVSGLALVSGHDVRGLNLAGLAVVADGEVRWVTATLGAVERSRYAGRSWMPEEGLEPPTRGL